MIAFHQFLLVESDDGDGKLKHIHHAEDRPLFHGKPGFEHAYGALMASHMHIKNRAQSNALTTKYDGSPSIVFGHDEQGKFFVSSKSAFNKNPKINYTPEDIDKNHGHAPGLAEKLKHALEHLPKVAPKEGTFQGDLMYSGDDVQKSKDGSVSFTPNTITYTAKGDTAKKISKSKLGVVVHTQYNDKGRAEPLSKDNENAFGRHPDVHWHSANYDAGKAKYEAAAQTQFIKHMSAAKAIHDKHGDTMYAAAEPHIGEAGHLGTYINQTVRDGSKPTSAGLQKHIAGKYQKMVEKLKTEKSQNAKLEELRGHVEHIKNNAEHYTNLLSMHHHLQQAKNGLVSSLESNEGEYAHSIGGIASKPEGFVFSHKGEPTKLVNRAEFARQNLLKVRTQSAATTEKDKHHVIAFGRMNPPTAGHEQVVNTLKDKAKEVGGDHTLILSHSHATKDGKNPLSPEQKLKHARNAFPKTNIEVASKDKPTLLHHAVDLYNKGVTHLHFIGGSDRASMADMLKKYNGQKSAHGYYNFKNIEFHSSGQREEGATGVTGISGTKLRHLAATGEKKEFHSNLPSKMKPEHKDALYNDLRKAMP
jgi:hypothetical protein